jgi:hypothetical protein
VKLTRNTNYINKAGNLQVWVRSTETEEVKFAAYETVKVNPKQAYVVLRGPRC